METNPDLAWENRPKHRYELRLAVEGRIRFLSHLETVDTLLSALRRSGVRLALSRGMKPKPLIKVAMPRPVAVEAWGEIVEVELQEAVDPDVFALNLSSTLPAGLTLQGVRAMPREAASSASRVAGSTFRIWLDDAPVEQVEQWVEAFLASEAVTVRRKTPKQDRDVDVRAVIGDMAVTEGPDPAVRVYARLTESGSVKPDEVVRALSTLAGRDLAARRIVRESITLAEPGGDGRVADVALVGADVPDGPAKPWGAC